jgi:hypothetical protein
MVFEKEIFVVTVLVFGCSLWVEANRGSLFFNLTYTIVVRGNKMSFYLPSRGHLENNLFNSFWLVFVFHVNLDEDWLILFPLFLQLLLYRNSQVIFAVSFLVLFFKRNLEVVLFVQVNVPYFALVNHVFNNSAILLN